MACTLWPIVGKHDIRKVIIISTTKWEKVKHEKGKKKTTRKNSEKSGSIAMSPEGNQSMAAGNMHSIFGEVRMCGSCCPISSESRILKMGADRG